MNLAGVRFDPGFLRARLHRERMLDGCINQWGLASMEVEAETEDAARRTAGARIVMSRPGRFKRIRKTGIV